MINYAKKHKGYLIIGAVALIAILYFLFGRGGSKTEYYTVGRADVTQSVILSGKVQTSDRADLGFAASGRVGKIYVKNNQKVAQGSVLAQLEIGDLLADLRIKQAGSRTSEVDLKSAKDELENVEAQENTKVESAYRNLLTGGLEMVPDSDYEVEPPTVGGIYDGSEGRYKISIHIDNAADSGVGFLTFDLERTRGFINNDGPTRIGTRGLYISFPDSPSLYRQTTWFLDIPNKSSSLYLSNLNAYNEAKNERDLAIKNAESDYQKLLTENDGGDSVALAEIQKINAEIRKNTIYAPFSGKVSNIEKEVGENADVGERIVSILGEDKLEIVLQVSELDVSRISPGTTISITLDAFPEESFEGVLTTINSRETTIEGVPVYEAFVELPADERIKTGMSAKGTIILAEKKGVLAIPTYLIKKIDGQNIVEMVLADGSTEEAEVVPGLTGTDSLVEIISGINQGDKILASDKK